MMGIIIPFAVVIVLWIIYMLFFLHKEIPGIKCSRCGHRFLEIYMTEDYGLVCKECFDKIKNNYK